MANTLQRSWLLAATLVVLLGVDCIQGGPMSSKNKNVRKRQIDGGFLGTSVLPNGGEEPSSAPTTIGTSTEPPSSPPTSTALPETSTETPRPAETSERTSTAGKETSTPTSPPTTTAAPQELSSTSPSGTTEGTSTVRTTIGGEVTSVRPIVINTAPNPVNLVDKSVFACGPEHDPLKNYPSQKDPCNHHFYSCSGPDNQAWEFTCPENLYFDKDLGENGECHAYLDVPACSGSPRPVKPTPEATKAPRPTVAPAYDCRSKKDGLYADPSSKPRPMCSRRFFECVGNVAYEYLCDSNLIFNPRLANGGGCDYRNHVFECTGREWTEPITSKLPPLPTWAPVKFDCKGHADGEYPDKCANHYFSCSNGQARLMQCPAPNLAFDPDTKQCLLRSDIVICGGSKKTTSPLPSTATIITLSTEKPALDCTGRPDGDYRDPINKCSHVFYKCSNNRTTIQPCTGNLFFNPVTMRCDNWIAIYDCSGYTPTPVVPSSPPTPRPTFPTVDFDCSRRYDGDYANPSDPCSTFFYKCSNSQAFKTECSDGLYYNPLANPPQCDSWIHVYGCSNMTMPPTTPSTSTLPPTTRIPLYDCTNKDDGYYVDPLNKCSSVYYYCNDGRDDRLECPLSGTGLNERLVWDDYYKQCNWRTETYACTGITPTQPPPSTSSTPVPTFPPVDFDCLDKDDGNYPVRDNNCSSYYISCTNGIALQRPCPSNQFFDPDTRQCNHRYYIVACGGRPQPTEASSLTTKPPRPAYPFDCTKRWDGYYASGDCESIYWSCIGGTTEKLDCRTPQSPELVYDPEINACAFRSDVPKCGGVRPTPAPSTTRGPTTPAIFDCSRKFDGDYEDPVDKCSQRYITCSNGFTYVRPCGAPGLYFDIVSDKCLRRDMVASCTGQTEAPLVGTTPGSNGNLTAAPTMPIEASSSTTAAPLPESSSTIVASSAPESSAGTSIGTSEAPGPQSSIGTSLAPGSEASSTLEPSASPVTDSSTLGSQPPTSIGTSEISPPAPTEPSQ
jgi:hypothetical protein